MNKPALLLSLLALGALGLVACGGDDDDDQAHGDEQTLTYTEAKNGGLVRSGARPPTERRAERRRAAVSPSRSRWMTTPARPPGT
jgi:hypothetical protein